jgi:hypothetical protein
MLKSSTEARFAAIEAEIAQLKKQVAANDHAPTNWLTDTFGVYADFPEYDQVIEYGRQYRESSRPLAKAKTAGKRSVKKPATQKA